MKISEVTIRGKVSAVRFWHVWSGLGDFAKGGGRYKEVMKSIVKGSKTKRGIPSGLELVDWALRHALMDEESQPIKDELLCATSMGFLILLRVGGD